MHKTTSIPLFVRNNVHYLAFHRRNRLLSQQKLAQLLNIPRYQVADWERGKCFPSKDYYNKLAEFFDWEVWE